MTYKRMVKRIADRTGVPVSVVRYILDTQVEELRACLIAWDEIHFPELLKITADPRQYRIPSRDSSKEVTFTEVERVVLKIRPMRALRAELNRWIIPQE